jgi:acyl carrier protein
MADVYAAVRDALATFNIPPEDVRPETTLAALDMDSLALAEFALILQEQLDVKVDSEHATKDTTISEVVAFLETRQAESAGAR